MRKRPPQTFEELKTMNYTINIFAFDKLDDNILVKEMRKTEKR